MINGRKLTGDLGPIPEGTHDAGRVERGDPTKLTSFFAKATLAEIAREYALFNHGAFFTHGRFDTDPMAFYLVKNPAVSVYPLEYSIRFFAGMDCPWSPIHWENRLFACALEDWEPLFAELRLASWVDRRRGEFYRACDQRIRLLDHMAINDMITMPHGLPTVIVHALGVDGNRTHVVYKEGISRPGDMARIVHMPPREDTIQLAKTVLAGDPRPFRAIELEDPFEGLNPPTAPRL